MKGPRPSLVRRLLPAFILGPLVAFFVFVLAIRPLLTNFEETNVGPDIVLVFLAEDLRKQEGEGLSLQPGSRVLGIAGRSPTLWFVARQGGTELVHGRVPKGVRELMRTLPTGTRIGSLTPFSTQIFSSSWR
jgi:hypothetical protein